MDEIDALKRELQDIRKKLDKFAYHLSNADISASPKINYENGIDKVLVVRGKLKKHSMSRKSLANKYAYLTLLYSLASMSKENNLVEKEHVEKIGQVLGVNKMEDVVDSIYEISEIDIMDSAKILRKGRNVLPFLVDAFILLLAYEEKNNKAKKYLSELITILGSNINEVEHAIRVSKFIICQDKEAYNNYKKLKYGIDNEYFIGWIDALGWGNEKFK